MLVKIDRTNVIAISLSAATLLYHLWTRKQRKEQDNAVIGVATFTESLSRCDKVVDVIGPLDIPSQDGQVAFLSFKISHFSSKGYITIGSAFDCAVHLKLQTIFEDNRPNMSEEERYFIANEWNATKRYTRCKYNSVGSSSAYEPGTFTLEYDILLPGRMPHALGVELMDKTLTMWHTSAVACVLHIVNYKKATLPFATHGSIVGNTLEFQVSCGDLLQQQCAICLETFQADEWVRRLPCLHVFHTGFECNIDTHLVRDKQCPVCRTPIDVMDSISSMPKKQPELARAVVHLQQRFNEFHDLVSNMREMLHQLRVDYQSPTQRSEDQTPSVGQANVPACEVFDAVTGDKDTQSSATSDTPPTNPASTCPSRSSTYALIPPRPPAPQAAPPSLLAGAVSSSMPHAPPFPRLPTPPRECQPSREAESRIQVLTSTAEPGIDARLVRDVAESAAVCTSGHAVLQVDDRHTTAELHSAARLQLAAAQRELAELVRSVGCARPEETGDCAPTAELEDSDEPSREPSESGIM